MKSVTKLSGLILSLLAFLPGEAKAQYIPAYQPDSFAVKAADVIYWHKKNTLKHLELSLSVGTTGIGLDVATPLSQYVQIRAGFDYMPRFKAKYKYKVLGDGQEPVKYDSIGNRVATPFDGIAAYMYDKKGINLEDHISLTGQAKMNNARILVDVYPFHDKDWHFTAGIYYGSSEFARFYNTSDPDAMLQNILTYNQIYRDAAEGDEVKKLGLLSIQMGLYSHSFKQDGKSRLENGNYIMEPTQDGRVEISCTSNSFKPYLGFGYGGRLFPSRNDWKISVEAGALIWGGTPSQTTHDGTELSHHVKDYPHSITGIIKMLKVYPVLSVRIAKTLF